MAHWLDDLYELCETVSREIGEANEKIRSAGGKLSGSDIDYIDKLTHTMKSIKTTIAMAEAEDEYSDDGSYDYRGGSYARDGGNRGGGRSNRGGMSNAQRRDSMGRYSRENRRGGGYSRDDARDDMIADLRELMQDAPDEHTKKRFQSFIRELENA